MMSLPPSLAMVLFLFVRDVFSDEHEYRLMKYLMANYDKSVRPSTISSDSLNITFGVALTQIIDVDERNQILTTNCWLNQMWIDYNLKWNESEFGGVRVIRIPADKVWKPDIILYNNADSQYNLAVLSTNVIVSSDGNLTWLSSAILKSSCGIDVEYFPFDEQQCTLKFASWTYDGHQLNLVIQTEDGDLSNYVTNGEWDLIDVIVKRNVVYYSCCEAPYPDVTYRMVLRRRPLFYAFNLILPCILITGIALMSFYMPSDSGEKVTLGITTLLSMTVFLMVIGESMPPTSEKLPLIGIYYGVTISLVTFATGLAVVTLNIHHRGMRGREVSSVVKKIVLGFLARILFIKLEVPERKWPATKTDYQEMTSPIYDISGANDRRRDNDDGSFKCDNNGGLHYRYGGGVGGGHLSSSLGLPDPAGSHIRIHEYCSPFERHVTKVLDRLHRTIEHNDIRLSEQDRKDAIRTEWQQVALVLDRFLLALFIVATVGATWSILYMSPYTKLF